MSESEDAAELFRRGELAAALRSQTECVKTRPTDIAARTLFFELLSFAAEFDRAGKQLDVIEQLDAGTTQAVQVYKNLLHAEGTRREFFSGRADPGFLRDAPAHVEARLQAVAATATGDSESAARIVAEAESSRPSIQGHIDGSAFDDLRDCDDLLAPVLEVFLLRDYIWLPFEHIGTLTIAEPERPRDLIWPTIQFSLYDGTNLSAYMPALYPTSKEADDAILLGRRSEWVERAPGVTVGNGQKTLLAGEGHAVLSVRKLTMLPE